MSKKFEDKQVRICEADNGYIVRGCDFESRDYDEREEEMIFTKREDAVKYLVSFIG